MGPCTVAGTLEAQQDAKEHGRGNQKENKDDCMLPVNVIKLFESPSHSPKLSEQGRVWIRWL